MRLPPQPAERIFRDRPLTIFFEGRPVPAFEGDSIGGALFAAGHRVFSRSFKYHRPRGLLCCSGRCPNCLMEVDGVPNVRVCVEPVRPGARVKAQNVLGSLEHDLLAVIDKVGGPFTPVGFYYRTMIHPRRAWPLYERILRHVAGLGRVDKRARRTRQCDVEHRRGEVLVIGGGRAGREAAREAASRGRQVVLVDDGWDLARDQEREDLVGVEVLAPARAIGIYEGGLVPVDAGEILYRIRAERIVVATGGLEQPLLFPGNDLVGVMLPGAVRRLVDWWSVKPGERAVVISADAAGNDAAVALAKAGVEVAEVFDLRTKMPSEIATAGRRGRLRSVTVDGRTVDCDLLVVSGSRQPNYSLLAQAGARIRYDASKGIFVPAELPAHVEAVGAVCGDAGPVAVPASQFASRGVPGIRDKCFVCLCEDVTTKDIKRAIAEGFDSIELAKRYTTVTMGPCQGSLCHLPSIRLYASEAGKGEEAIGTTTARPPCGPVSLGLLAARHHEPTQRTSIHHRHKDLGAQMMWTGSWRRPHSYGDPQDEVRAVHDSMGIIDVSTLGKLLVTGPHAARFLERLYPNRFSDLKPGRIRYGVLQTDAGRIMDDGTIARLAAEEFYVTTTSTGTEGVVEWFEWWNACWHMEVEIVNLTGALGAINVAGPRVRELMVRVTDLAVSAEGFGYLDAKRARVAGVPCLLLRIGFVGELGYELHFPSCFGVYLWDTLLEQGADLGLRPFGLEPQRVLRLEKMHILPGQDTDSESNVLEANMPWLVKWDKEDFVGKWALEHVRERGHQARLVGFEMANGVVPAEGAQVVIESRPGGRVTSSRWSPHLKKVIGMAWVPPALAAEGAEIQIKVNGSLERASVRLRPFFDAEGERLRS